MAGKVPEKKQCNQCGKPKALKSFHFDHVSEGSRSGTCNFCSGGGTSPAELLKISEQRRRSQVLSMQW